MTLTIIVIIVIGLVLGAVLAVRIVSNSMSSRPTQSVADGSGQPQELELRQGPASVDLPAQEQTDAGARAAAQQAFDLYSAGSYGPFWDRWSAGSQALVSRDDYLTLHEQCAQPAENLRFTVNSATVTGTTAKVQANRLIAAFTVDFVYEGEVWRYVLPADQQQEHRLKNVDQIVRERKASNLCGKDLRLTPVPAQPPATQAPTVQTPAAQPLTVAKVGETVTVNGVTAGTAIAVTLNRVIVKGTPANQFLMPKPGNRFAAVELTIKNVGTAVYSDSPIIGAAIIDSEGRQHRTTLGDITEGTSFGGAVTIAVGDSRKGLITFEVPESAKLAKLQFGPTFSRQKGEWVL